MGAYDLLSDAVTDGLLSDGVTYGLLSDGVTDVSNQDQNVSFIKYYDQSAGDARAVYIDTCELLAGEEEECSADGETTFKSLIALLKRLGLSLSELKAMASDGASVVTGNHTGIGPKFKERDECKAMLSVHCICHRVAIACAGTGNGLEFVKSFESTMISLWPFFTNSPKRLKNLHHNYIRMQKCFCNREKQKDEDGQNR